MKRDYKPILKDVISYALIIIAVVLIRLFIFDPVRVDGPSMDNTLKDGQVLILNKIGYKKSEIKRYDIVVADVCLDGSKTCAKTERVVKRVIGLPNDTIYAKDGKVYVNGDEVDYSFVKKETKTDANGNKIETQETTEDFELEGFTKLEGDSYFLMGDNREISYDSRSFGPVKRDQIKGKAVFRIWPINKIKILK